MVAQDEESSLEQIMILTTFLPTVLTSLHLLSSLFSHFSYGRSLEAVIRKMILLTNQSLTVSC